MSEPDQQKQQNLEKKLSFSQIEERLVVVSFSNWIALISFFILVAAAITWLFFGSLPIKTSGKAISLTTGGVLNVSSQISGKVVKINIEVGDEIEEGEEIAVIQNLDLEVELKNAIKRRDSLYKDLQEARLIASLEEKNQENTLEEKIAAARFELEQREKQLPFLKNDFRAKQTLYHEQLISSGQLENAKRLLMEEKVKIRNLKSALIDYEAKIQEHYKSDELKNYERLYRDAVNEVERIETKGLYSEVLSPAKGTVLEVQVRLNEEVEENQPIAWIEKSLKKGESYVFFAYVNAQEGHKIQPGMQAEIELASVDPDVYGYLVGQVKTASKYPVTDQHIYSIVHSDELIKFLRQDLPAIIEVVIEPVVDETTPSGLKWTSGKGPDMQLRSGLISDIKITIERKKPISYIFPN